MQTASRKVQHPIGITILIWLTRFSSLELQERLFLRFLARLYVARGKAYIQLFEDAPLRFAPNISLKLLSTDKGHQPIAFLGFYEAAVSRRIAELAKTGRLMVDVGANYGYYSCLWAGIRPDNYVIAFEASPRNSGALRTNTIHNGLQERVEIREVAVGRSAGTLPFSLGPDDQSGWGGLIAQKEDGTVDVPVIQLDHFSPEGSRHTMPTIDLLKIDTEGADAWVLEGAQQLLRAHKIRNIFFEENIARMTALGITPGQSQALLRRHGYVVEQIADGEWFAHI